jgi:DNA-binding CsgD family transcriptional regulator
VPSNSANGDQPSVDAALVGQVFLFKESLSELLAPQDVLIGLGAAIDGKTPLKVLGAARVPIHPRDWLSAKLGETVFLAHDAPSGWWDEYMSLAATYLDQDLMMARTSLAPFTWTESRQMLEPIGIDRWPYDLALKYGMRDGFTCPVGRRWILAFWSPKLLGRHCNWENRAIIFLAANFAALRLEQLLPSSISRLPRKSRLTPRELAVLRLSSMGQQAAEAGAALGLGEETVRSHLKKAQQKLGARNRTQAVAEALRQNLIP